MRPSPGTLLALLIVAAPLMAEEGGGTNTIPENGAAPVTGTNDGQETRPGVVGASPVTDPFADITSATAAEDPFAGLTQITSTAAAIAVTDARARAITALPEWAVRVNLLGGYDSNVLLTTKEVAEDLASTMAAAEGRAVWRPLRVGSTFLQFAGEARRDQFPDLVERTLTRLGGSALLGYRINETWAVSAMASAGMYWRWSEDVAWETRGAGAVLYRGEHWVPSVVVEGTTLTYTQEEDEARTGDRWSVTPRTFYLFQPSVLSSRIEGGVTLTAYQGREEYTTYQSVEPYAALRYRSTPQREAGTIEVQARASWETRSYDGPRPSSGIEDQQSTLGAYLQADYWWSARWATGIVAGASTREADDPAYDYDRFQAAFQITYTTDTQ
jgi:hypothetical protein